MAHFRWPLFILAGRFMGEFLCSSYNDGSDTGVFYQNSIQGSSDSPFYLASPDTTADCGNATHYWNSVNGSCFDETFTTKEDPEEKAESKMRNLFGRDLLCPNGQTSCWLVNCCQPGEICGALTEGCIISWSTIYTTTTSTYSATLTTTTTPKHPASTTVATVTSTSYVTSTLDKTVSGAGPDTVYSTSYHTVSTTVPAVYNAGPKVVTKTTTAKPLYTGPSSGVKSRGELQKRTQRTSYTTITRTVTAYKTAAEVTETFSGKVLTQTLTLTETQTAVRTQTHYQTTNSFELVTVDITATVSEYAYGTHTDPGTITYTTTVYSPVSSKTKLAAEPAGVSSDPSSNGDQPKKHHGLSKGAIAGIVLGTLIALIILAALLFFCFLLCSRRRRMRKVRKYEDPPTPPSPPEPQSPMTSINMYHDAYDDYGPYPRRGSPLRNSFTNGNNGNGNGDSISPVIAAPAAAALAAGGAAHHHRRNRSNHSRKGSRGSVVSVSPVPEEDEEFARVGSNRSSTDSLRWGRGYGGRGGYNSPVGRGGNRMSSPSLGGNNGASRSNRQFSGQPMTSYTSENLIPPHTRSRRSY